MRADHEKIRRLISTARGQLDGILKMVEEDRYCVDISNQLMAAQAILRRANREVIQAHMASCVREAMAQGDEAAMEQKIQELAGIMDQLAK